jgi:hypothetical protein
MRVGTNVQGFASTTVGSMVLACSNGQGWCFTRTGAMKLNGH